MSGVRGNGILQTDDVVPDTSGGGGGSSVSITGPTGQQLAADSLPVVIANDQSPIPVNLSGVSTEVKQDNQITQLSSVIAGLAGILSQLDVALSTRLAEATFTTRTNTLGQKLMATSMPVVFPSDQSLIPTDTHNTSPNSPLIAAVVGGGNVTGSQFFMLPVMAHNWDRPTSNNQAVSVVIRNGTEVDGNAKLLNDFISIGGLTNSGTNEAVKMPFGDGNTQTANPSRTFGAVTREYGQSFSTSGSISVAGSRATVSNRYVSRANAIFVLQNSSFIGTIRPVVSIDNGTTWAYCAAINTITGAQVVSLTDALATGSFVIPFGAGATDFGFEVTARTSGSITWRASANSIGSNSLLTLTTQNTPQTIIDGRKVVAVAGTRETLVGASVLSSKVIITAELTNTGIIVIGGITCVAAAATRRGTPLVAGARYEFNVFDLQSIYIDSTVNGEGISYTSIQ